MLFSEKVQIPDKQPDYSPSPGPGAKIKGGGTEAGLKLLMVSWLAGMVNAIRLASG